MKKAKPAPLPESGRTYHRTMDELGLRAISYRREVYPDNYAVPRDILGTDGNTVIIWREPDKSYAIAGWEPWHSGMFGGRYDHLGAALSWVAVAYDIKAGKRADFGPVVAATKNP